MDWMQLLMHHLFAQQPPPQYPGSGGRWQAIQDTMSGATPLTGTYSIDADNVRFPTMVPGNTQWLTPLIKMGVHPQINDDQFHRALAYALQTGNYKPANEPMSPLGSEFDFYNPSGARLNDLRALNLLDILRGNQ